jgi:hypothetical protein
MSDDQPQPFWTKDPNVLFRTLAFYPSEKMTLAEKCNAVSRLIMVLAVVGYVYSQNITLIFLAVVLLVGVYVFYDQKRAPKTESFLNSPGSGLSLVGKSACNASGGDIICDPSATQLSSCNLRNLSGGDVDGAAAGGKFQMPIPSNPLGNVLITDWADSPDRSPAIPSSSPEQQSLINETVKTMVGTLNSDSTGSLTTRLFGNLGDQFQFEQSMRQFYSAPSTTIPHDQGAFANFCFGDMVSCKQGNKFACARNLPRLTLN